MAPVPITSSTADLQLWLAYQEQLKQFFPYTKDSDLRIYSVPFTSTAITTGKSLNEAVMNHDLFRVGDLLLPARSPVFIPGMSYSQRLLRYLQAVKIDAGKQDAETRERLLNANRDLALATDQFLSTRKKAHKSYMEDQVITHSSFSTWLDEFYPAYRLALEQQDAAAQRVAEASAVFSGPQAYQLWRDKTRVAKAFVETNNAPYNMPTTVRQATSNEIISSKAADPKSVQVDKSIEYEPRYSIASNFNVLVQNWVESAADSTRQSVEIKFKVEKGDDDSQEDWDEVGFDAEGMSLQPEVLPSLPLFTASWDKEATDPRNASLVEGLGHAHAAAEVIIRASDAAVFAVSPDSSWDLPQVSKIYPNLRKDASKELFEPLVLVTHIFLGYQVAVDITIDDTTFTTITKGLDDARKADGVATLFGIDIGPSSAPGIVQFGQIGTDTTHRTISIPPRDNTQLTVLGIMGKKLPFPRR